ncbi:hypothetical protein C8R46DRAFT_1217109 [Mycena filopes]|nr:hypothetical protein C8R46DRAFT_1217109 [Mycena filopes]
MTQLTADQSASEMAAPCTGTTASPPTETPDASYPIPSGAAHAYSMLSIAANALASAAGAPPPPSPAPTSASQGIQHQGPWIAGALYGVVPTGPLTVIPDNGEHWYAITKGLYVGVTNSTAIADGAVTRVSDALRINYKSQADAVNAFNQALALNIGLVKVIGVD